MTGAARPEEDDVILTGTHLALWRPGASSWWSPARRVVLRSRDATRLTCAMFDESAPDASLLAQALGLWLTVERAWVAAPALRLFRSCQQPAIRQELARLLPSLPDRLHYELAETLAFDSPESDSAADFRARLRLVNSQRLCRGLGRLDLEDQRRLAQAMAEEESTPLAPASSSHLGRLSRCWSCLDTVMSRENDVCTDCGWLICSCGACRDPRWGACVRTTPPVRA